jgi:hypothetical protein
MSQEMENLATYGAIEPIFVGPEEFYRLAISNRQLDRRDDRRSGLRGLCDTQTGQWFVIEEDRLYGTSPALS